MAREVSVSVGCSGLAAHELDGAMKLITASLAELPPKTVVTLCGRFHDQLAAVEAQVLADAIGPDGDDRQVRRLAKRHGSSKRDQARRSTRARAVAANRDLGDQMARGDLSAEQLDVLAEAAAKSDDAALADEDLVRRVGRAGPDQGRKIARRWLHDRDNATTVNDRYKRQRRMRSSSRFDTADDLAAILIQGDSANIDAAWNGALADADRMYKADGGRDLPAGEHARTHEQRMFDALIARMTGSGDAGHEDASAASAARPTVVVTVSLDKLVGQDPDDVATQVGTGPIDDAVLSSYLAHGNVVGLLFGAAGQPLWLGRRRRNASAGQFLALMVRDKGCVLCDAPAHVCEAHHRIPWHAPAQGTTDIDQLVLLCGRCHRGVHDAKETVIWDRSHQVWLTRPATPAEIPPSRPLPTHHRDGQHGDRRPRDRPQRE